MTAKNRIIAEYLDLFRKRLTLIHKFRYDVTFIFTVCQSADVNFVFVTSTHCTIGAILVPDFNHTSLALLRQCLVCPRRGDMRFEAIYVQKSLF